MKTILKIFFSLSLVVICKDVIAQDSIFKLNRQVIVAKVLELTATEVRYKKADMPDGPLYTEMKSEIQKIKYANGSQDIFVAEKKENGTETSYKNVEPYKAAVDTSRRYIITLDNGTKLKGKIVSQTKTEVVFMDNNIGERTIQRTSIKSVNLEYGDEVRIFTLSDGTIISGKIINKTESATVVESKELGVMVLKQSSITGMRELETGIVTEEGKIWFKNPNCTRYLFAPSAMALKKGEGYYQNIYGVGNAFNYGLSNAVSIGGGLAGPVGVYLNTKAGFKVVKNVHVAVGALFGNSFFPLDGDNFGVGMAFGVITLGSYDHNLTFGASYGFKNSGGETSLFQRPIFVANGTARIGEKFALVTENWIANIHGDPFERGFSSNSDHYDTFFSYAFRYMGQTSTLDAGFLNTPALIEMGWYIGIPYIGFVFRFGKYKDN